MCLAFRPGFFVGSKSVRLGRNPHKGILVHQVFGVGTTVDTHPLTGRPRINFYLDGSNKDGSNKQNLDGVSRPLP